VSSPVQRSVAIFVASAAAMVACAPRPSPAQCEAMVEHIVALTRESHEGSAAEIAAGVAEEHRAALLERCASEGTAAEVECVLAAGALDEIQTCAPRR
jgi:hypothetical protein